MIKAVVFDLDDTLCPEREYVKSGFKAIAKHFDDNRLYEKLMRLFDEDKTNVYQRAGFSELQCKECIEVYRRHKPTMQLAPNIAECLQKLKAQRYKIGIITDGRPEGQRNKIAALGLDEFADKIIVTDELGGVEYRKPNPRAFELMRNALGVEFDEMIYVGDNPQKDFAVKAVYPIVTVRVENGGIYVDMEYKDGIEPDYIVENITKVIEVLR